MLADVGQRLLGGAVDRQPRLGAELARLARDLDLALDLPAGGEALDQGRQPLRAGQVVAAQRLIACRASSSPRVASWWARSIALSASGSTSLLAGQQPGAFELDRQGRERVGEDVVHLAGDAAALGQAPPLRSAPPRLRFSSSIRARSRARLCPPDHPGEPGDEEGEGEKPSADQRATITGGPPLREQDQHVDDHEPGRGEDDQRAFSLGSAAGPDQPTPT